MSLTLLRELDLKILCCLDSSQLSTVNAYFYQLSTSEDFYRIKLCDYFNIDIFPLNNKQTYKEIYFNIFIKNLSPIDIFEVCWGCGYTPIIKALLKKYPLVCPTLNEIPNTITFFTSIEEFGGSSNDEEKMIIMEEFCDCGLPIKFISWDLTYYYTQHNDIVGLQKWMSKGLSLKDNCCFALRNACSKGFNELAQFLILHGANINIEEYAEDWTPLIYAVKYCNVETVKMLVENGAKDDVDGYSIFTKKIWEGGDMLEKTTPSKGMLEYLESIKDNF